MDLGLQDFQFKVVTATGGGFEWFVTFFLSETGRYYMNTGTAPSIEQCYRAAMAFLSEAVREAVKV